MSFPQIFLTLNPPNIGLMFSAIASILAVAGVVVSLFFSKYALLIRRTDRARGSCYLRMSSWLATWSVLGLFWIFAAYERINLFGALFWILIGVVLALLWIAAIVVSFHRQQAIQSKEQSIRGANERYLPKSKK